MKVMEILSLIDPGNRFWNICYMDHRRITKDLFDEMRGQVFKEALLKKGDK